MSHGKQFECDGIGGRPLWELDNVLRHDKDFGVICFKANKRQRNEIKLFSILLSNNSRICYSVAWPAENTRTMR